MGEGMCEFKSSPKEIEYFNEYKVTFFFKLFCVHIFSILTLHSLTFSSFFFNFYYASNIFFFFCRFDSKVIFFQKALQFKETIILCYNRLNFVKVPPPLTRHICWIIIDSLGPIVYACILTSLSYS